MSTTIKHFAVGLYAPNIGPDVEIDINGSYFYHNTQDITIEHDMASGTINTIATKDLISIDPLAAVAVFIQDSSDGSIAVSGDYYQGSSFETLQNYTSVLTQGQSLGAMVGGAISDGGGLSALVDSGYGYLNEGEDPYNYAKYVPWVAQSVLLTANSDNYVYIDTYGDAKSSVSLPGRYTNIILGKARTTASSILFFQDIEIEANNTGTKLDYASRLGLGPIYSSGSITSANASAMKVDVSGGTYYYGTHIYNPSGATAVKWTSWYHTAGEWTPLTNQDTIDNNYYDDPSTGLTTLTGTECVKHSLYVVNDGDHESYHLVYGQTNFANPAAAIAGGTPNPPGTWTSNIVRIAGIVAQKDTGTITTEGWIIDLRPRLSFVAPAGTTITVHNDLTGRDSPVAHSQYLLKDGTDAMTGNLNLNTYNVDNVGTVDGVDVSSHASRHLPNSASDPLTSAAPDTNLSPDTTNATGTSNAIARSNHTHRIGNAPVTAGVYGTPPTWTDNGDGTANIGACSCLLYSTSDYSGNLLKYSVSALSGATFTTGVNNYVIINYNSGSPLYQVTTNVELITESSVIPIFTVYKYGTDLFYIDWDSMADGMPNKIHQRFVKTERFARESGFGISESGTRVVNIEAGKLWYGGIRSSLDAFVSSVDTWRFWYHVSSVWTQSTATTQYNNSQYDDGTDLVTLTDGYFTVNWIYRGSGSMAHAHYILGNSEYSSIAAAIESQPPTSIPPMISSSAFLIGRIIIGKGKNAATGSDGKIESAFTVKFTPVPVNSHNELYSLQGGIAGEYYHTTSAQHAGLTTASSTGSILRANGTVFTATTATYPNTTTANQLLYSSGTNTVAGLATGNSSVLVTNGSGAPSLSTDIPTAVTIGGSYVYRGGGTDVTIADGGTNSSAALNNNRVMQSSSGAIVEAAAITANRALISDANGIPIASVTTATEIGYVNGVTSAIQTQLDGKASTTNPTFTSITISQNMYTPVVSLTLNNGANDNVVIGNGFFFRIVGPTANFNVSGIAGGTDGRTIMLFWNETTGTRFTINNDNASSTAANRIWTCTNSDLQTGAIANSRGIFKMVYSGTDSRWVMVSYIL